MDKAPGGDRRRAAFSLPISRFRVPFVLSAVDGKDLLALAGGAWASALEKCLGVGVPRPLEGVNW